MSVSRRVQDPTRAQANLDVCRPQPAVGLIRKPIVDPSPMTMASARGPLRDVSIDHDIGRVDETDHNSALDHAGRSATLPAITDIASRMMDAQPISPGLDEKEDFGGPPLRRRIRPALVVPARLAALAVPLLLRLRAAVRPTQRGVADLTDRELADIGLSRWDVARPHHRDGWTR